LQAWACDDDAGTQKLPRAPSAGNRDYSRGKLVHGLASSTASINKKAERLEVLEDTDLLPPPMSPVSRAKAERRYSVAGRRQSVGFGFGFQDIMSPSDAMKAFDMVESTLQELKKTFRTDDVGEERADDSEEKRAEERRKREQEAKKAREKAQNTKDPRRRVAVMLEQGREWGQARPDQARDRKVNVPMQQHLALHSGGAERIEMVHVCALQGRCKGLSSGSCNYKEVRNLVEEEERQAKWLQSTAPAEPKDFIKDNKALSSCYSTGEYSQDAAEALEAKLALAKKRKARAHEAKLQKKLEMLIKRRSPSVMTGSIRRASGQKAASPDGRVRPRMSMKDSFHWQLGLQQEQEQSPVWRALRGTIHDAVDFKWQARTKPSTPKGSDFKQRLKRRIIFHRRLHFLRLVTKAASAWVMLFARVKRRHRSHDKMLHLFGRIAGCTEACQLVRKFNYKVVQLQRLCRAFILRKRAWSKKVSKQWKALEDKHLHNYFSMPWHLEERRRSSGSRRYSALSAADKAAALSGQTAEEKEDMWKVFRIPKEHRLMTLGRYFICKAKYRLLQIDVCQDMMEAEVTTRKEMSECFGLEPDGSQEQKALHQMQLLFGQKKAMLIARYGLAKFMHVDEEEMVDLIALAAFELRGKQPFQDHPANATMQVVQGKLSARFFRIIQRQSIDANQDQPSSPNRMRWGQTARKQVAINPKAKKDVDSLMKRFSPRFLQESTVDIGLDDEAFNDSAVPLPLDEESDLDLYGEPIES